MFCELLKFLWREKISICMPMYVYTLLLYKYIIESLSYDLMQLLCKYISKFCDFLSLVFIYILSRDQYLTTGWFIDCNFFFFSYPVLFVLFENIICIIFFFVFLLKSECLFSVFTTNFFFTLFKTILLFVPFL